MSGCGAVFYATLQPDIIVAAEGDRVEFICSTNILGARFPRGWVINGRKSDLRQGLPQFYTVNGFIIVFEQRFNEIIKYQCYFSIHLNGSDIDIYSNEAFLVPDIESTRGECNLHYYMPGPSTSSLLLQYSDRNNFFLFVKMRMLHFRTL